MVATLNSATPFLISATYLVPFTLIVIAPVASAGTLTVILLFAPASTSPAAISITGNFLVILNVVELYALVYLLSPPYFTDTL